ncbi:MAG: ABC transporter ATP-binding protein [Cyanobacteria bacterium P01_F01_bin.86]
MKFDSLLIKLVKQYPHWVVLSIILGFSGNVFNGIGITLLLPLLQTSLGSESVDFSKFPSALSSLFQVFDSIPEQFKLFAMVACVFMAIVLKNVATYAGAITSGILNRRFSSNLRKQSFKLLLDVDLDYFAEMRLGDLMNYVNNEVNRTAGAVSSIVKLIIATISICGYLIVLVLISWRLTLLASVLLGAVALVNQSSMKRSKSAGREISKAAAELSRHAIEILSGMRLVKSVGNESAEYDTLKTLVERRESAAYRSQLIFASVSPLNEVASFFAIILLLVTGRFLFANQITNFAGTVVSYLFILSRLLPLVGQVSSARNKLANTAPSVEIMEGFLRRENKPIMQSGNQTLEDLKRGVHFKNVWFRYPSSDGWNLQNIDLIIPRGKTLALVGASGAGKSTLADLLARFYDPTEGSIELDGVDLRNCSLAEYRRKIGIVSQETFLFNTSVRDNIRYGRPTATDEEVFQAAKRANAAEFIQKLPEGFETLIGDRGVLLSGGQRQRIAIARALLQGPEILILDEATSALDTVSERLVQQALEDLSKERTTLVIAHRLSTVQNADQIAALDKGKVVEVGTHQALLGKGGYYANLHSIQFQENGNSSKLSASSNEAFKSDFGKVSYEIRSQLNGMLGLLSFLDEEMFEGPDEYDELMERAYQSTLNVMQSLENLEKKVLPAG